MSYQEVMNLVLPTQDDKAAHVTGHYGEIRARGPHGGSDFNYRGGQTGLNLTHPSVHSPVSGTVVFVGGQYGTIKVRDADGYTHEILHTNRQSVEVNQELEAGDVIGSMGGRGPRGSGQYAQHVHYQMKDRQGRLVNPEEFWSDRQIEGRAYEPALAPQLVAGVDRPQPPRHSEMRKPTAGSDGVLELGESGTEVRRVQRQLNDLGYRDAEGRVLTADGDFGKRTEEAVTSFQRAHGLALVDGVVGSKTLEALRVSEQAPLLSNPSHPDHAMYQQALRGVQQLPPDSFKNDTERSNAAATLVFEGKVSGVRQIDHVVLSTNGSGMFAVQGRLEDPAHSRIYVDRQQAAAQPVERSTEMVRQEMASVPTQDLSQAQAQQQVQQQHVEHRGVALGMGP